MTEAIAFLSERNGHVTAVPTERIQPAGFNSKLLDALGLAYIRGHCFPTHAPISLAREFTCVDHLVEKEYLLAGKFL